MINHLLSTYHQSYMVHQWTISHEAHAQGEVSTHYYHPQAKYNSTCWVHNIYFWRPNSKLLVWILKPYPLFESIFLELKIFNFWNYFMLIWKCKLCYFINIAIQFCSPTLMGTACIWALDQTSVDKCWVGMRNSTK